MLRIKNRQLNLKMRHAKETNSYVQIKTSLLENTSEKRHSRQLSLYLWNDFLWYTIKMTSKLGKIICIISMFERFHIFLLFYLLFSEKYACVTWKSQGLRHLSKKNPMGGRGGAGEFHVTNTQFYYYKLSFFLFRVFSE